MDVNGSSKSTDITASPPCGISLDLVQATYFVPFKCNYSTSHLQSAGIMPGLQVSRCHVSLNFNRVCPTQEIMPVAFFSRKAHQCSQQKSTLLLCSAKEVRKKKSQGVRVAAQEQKNRQGQLHVLPNHLGMFRDSETPAAQTMHALHFFLVQSCRPEDLGSPEL